MVIRLIDAKKRKWRIFFWYGGKQIKRVYCGDKRGAEDFAAKLRAGLAEGSHFPERALAKLTLAHVADRFIKEYARYKKSGENIGIYVRGAIAFFPAKKLAEITPQDVERFRQELGLRMKPVSVNHYQRALRRLIFWAEENHLFKGDNPASGKKVKFANERKYWRTEYLEAAQLKTLLYEADPRIRPIIMTAACSGLRLSELKRLACQDVNLDSCTIFIRESKNDEPGSVPIPEILFEVLEPILREAKSPECLVFDFKNFENFWTSARDRAGLRKFHFHDLRHTYASQVLMETKDLKAVQELLRHKDYRMTLRYAHLAPGHLRKAALTLDKTFASLRPETASTLTPVGKDSIPDSIPVNQASMASSEVASDSP